MGNCCFGNTIYATTEYIRCINDKVIFPVLLYRDILLYTFNEEKKDKLLELIPPCLIENNLVFDYDLYDYGKVIRLQVIGNYEDRLDEQFTAT